MKSDKLSVVRSWFKKAENDLTNAEHTMKMENPPCDTVCFHAQQCAEKYLKGFLTFHEIDLPKTHSVEELVSIVRLGICMYQLLSYPNAFIGYPEARPSWIPAKNMRE